MSGRACRNAGRSWRSAVGTLKMRSTVGARVGTQIMRGNVSEALFQMAKWLRAEDELRRLRDK